MPRLCEFYPGICLTTEQKARKNLSQCKKSLIQGKSEYISQKNVGLDKLIISFITALSRAALRHRELDYAVVPRTAIKETHCTTPYINIYGMCVCVPGSVVGIATGYGLDGPGIESRWGRGFPHLSRPALGSTQPPVQCVPGLSRR